MTDHAYTDPFAEITVVGCAIDNNHASRLAHQRLNVDDFNDPDLARLFAITPDLPITNPTPDDPWGPCLHQVRARQAATLTRLPPADIEAVCAARPVMADENGHYAHRVRQAATARRQRQQLIEALELLDGGDTRRYTTVLHQLTALAATP